MVTTEAVIEETDTIVANSSPEELEELCLELEKRISKCLKGCISTKTIKGKVRHYRQWHSRGKLQSKYIKDEELSDVTQQIQQRRLLEYQLKTIRAHLNADETQYIEKHYVATYDTERGSVSFTFAQDYNTYVIVDEGLRRLCESTNGLERRNCFDKLALYLNEPSRGRVCILYGLSRTGKTTMMKQALSLLSDDRHQRTAFIRVSRNNTIRDVAQDLQRLYNEGYRTVFIDEITLVRDFSESAAIFSDVFAAQGMHIVMAGSDTLNFWFAMNGDLYDRAIIVQTTRIPYTEHRRLLHLDDIDDYLRYGGTLKAGAVDKTGSLNLAEASFCNSAATDRYIEATVARNIRDSLAGFERGGHFRHLRDLYEAGELTRAIHTAIANINRSFLGSVLDKPVICADLERVARAMGLRRSKEGFYTLINCVELYNIDGVTRAGVEIEDTGERKIEITPTHFAEIEEYLRAIGLLDRVPVKTTTPNAEKLYRNILTQPGMRYSQSGALIAALEANRAFQKASEQARKSIANAIREEVLDELMCDMVLYETVLNRDAGTDAFRVQFAAATYDMVRQTDSYYWSSRPNYAVYAICRDTTVAPDRLHQLLDERIQDEFEGQFGLIVEKNVIYCGETMLDLKTGIHYINVKEYLESLAPYHTRADYSNSRLYDNEIPF